MGILESLGMRKKVQAVVEDVKPKGGDELENTINQRRFVNLDANGEVKLPKDAFAVTEHVMTEKTMDNGVQMDRTIGMYYSFLVPVGEEEPAPKEEPVKSQVAVRRR